MERSHDGRSPGLAGKGPGSPVTDAPKITLERAGPTPNPKNLHNSAPQKMGQENEPEENRECWSR